MRTLIEQIGELIAMPPGPRCGPAMDEAQRLHDAALLIEQGRIVWFGPQADAPTSIDRRIDAAGGLVIPGLIDCHTHIPFAGQRIGEFVRRVRGESYLSIMESGGGIRVSTRAVREATLDQLVEENLPRLRRMLQSGVTFAECKSGYGLRADAELMQLRAVQRLRAMQPVGLVATYLGAHALPAEFEGRPDAFIDAISDPQLLRTLAEQDLARFVDVFCDRGAFDVAQSRVVLERAQAAGLRSKLHADELAQIGASRLGAEMRAVSVDHLEHLDDGGIDALRSAGVVAVVLPGTSFFLGIPHADARRMIRGGLAVAIATDLNPGSSHIEALPFVMNIACCQLRMTPLETLTACTANAAAALLEHAQRGAIAPGYRADLVLLDCASLEEWFYTPGRSRVRMTLIDGQIAWERAA